jgi:glycyl-tRNA synthetase
MFSSSSSTSEQLTESNQVSPQPQVNMDDIVSLCKHRGIVFPSAEIYNSVSGVYDFGPLGVELKKNLKDAWWRDMVHRREDIVGVDCAILSPAAVWKASGHLEGFSDLLVDCRQSNLRYRADQLFWAKLETEGGEEVCYVCVPESDTMLAEATKQAHKIAKKKGISGPFCSLTLADLTAAPVESYTKIPSPATGEPGVLTLPPRDFNLMFKTSIGATAASHSLSAAEGTEKVASSKSSSNSSSSSSSSSSNTHGQKDDQLAHSTVYLRPETAQGIFTNYATIQRSERKKIPFGIAQIGKAFRNEITPRNFIFRSREFEQMEIEYFIPPEEDVWPGYFKVWEQASWRWLLSVGLDVALMGKQQHVDGKLAHYAKACTDITFKYPFGTQVCICKFYAYHVCISSYDHNVAITSPQLYSLILLPSLLDNNYYYHNLYHN